MLETFVEVVRQGSFAAVAKDRNIDPSSVSRAIAQLEKALGTRLFQRTTRTRSLTEAGALYYERIEPLIAEITAANLAAKELAGQPVGTLRITASVSFGLTCIVPHLPNFEARYPDLAVDLVLTDSVLDLVNEKIDVAVRLGVMADSTLIAQRLMRTEYFVCASPRYLEEQGHPQQPCELTERECLRFPLSGFHSQWTFQDKDEEIETVAVKGRTVISSAMGLRDCALAGMGLTLLPNWLVQGDLAAGRLINVFPQHSVSATTFDTAAWFVYPSKRYLPLKVKAFIAYWKALY